MFKRVSSIVLTVAMLLTMLCTFSFASAAGEPLSLAVTSDAVDGLVTAGQTVVVTVRVENYSPMLAINVVGSYSKDFFSNVEVKKTYKYQPLPDVAPDYWAEADCVKGSNMLQFVGNAQAGAGNEIKTIWADPYPIPTMDRVITVVLTVAGTVTPGSATDLKFHIGSETRFEDTSATYSTDDVTLTLKVKCDHDWVNPTWKAETETHTYTCSKCHETKDEACGSFTENVVPPACTADGYTEKTCGTCHHTYTEVDAGTATGHTWVPDETTSGADGKHECSVCGASEACDFDAGVRTDATCTEDAYTTYTCTVCGRSYNVVEEGSAAGHSCEYDDTTSGANAQHKCTVCGVAENCAFDEGVRTPATCTENAYTTYTCTVCGYSYDVVEEGTAGHTYGAWAHSYDEETNSHTHSRACSVCGDVETESCDLDVVPPTCVADGSMSCRVCGFGAVIPGGAGEHTGMVVRYKAPTADEDGYIMDYCEDCDTEIYSETIEAGEPYGDLKAEDAAWYYDAAVFCNALGFFVGEYGNFNGDDALTRGQAVTIIGRQMISDETINGMTDEEFAEFLSFVDDDMDDVAVVELTDLKGSYYDRFAMMLAHMGIVKGHDDQTFRGDDLITREELAALLMRYLEATGSDYSIGAAVSFRDVDQVSEWAKDIVVAAGSKGLFVGNEGNFNPKGNATRAEMAVLIERLIKADIEHWYGSPIVID